MATHDEQIDMARDAIAWKDYGVRFTDVPEERRAMVIRQADHQVTLREFVAQYGRREGIERFKAFWYGNIPDADALNAIAQHYYGKVYAALCCGEKRAVYGLAAESTVKGTD